MNNTIEWRVTQAQKELILRAILNCPTDVGNGVEETARHRVVSSQVQTELEELGHEGLWWFLNGDTRS